MKDTKTCCDSKRAVVIAVTNQKGGAGKTTVTINLATALGMIGNSVLIIDVDKQINMTSGLIKETERLDKKNIGAILDAVLNDQKINIKRYITHLRYLDIIAGNRLLYTYKNEFEEREDRNTVYKNLIEPIICNYDYILFDCPPDASVENVKAYTAASKILIVSEPTKFSTDGVVDAVEIAQYTKKSTNKDLDILGIVINKYNKVMKAHNEFLEVIYNEYGKYINVFNSVIPQRAAIEKATNKCKSVLQHRSNDDSSRAFLQLAKEIVNEVNCHG